MKKLMIAILILLFSSPVYGWDDHESARYRHEAEEARQEADDARREAEDARREAERKQRKLQQELGDLKRGMGRGRCDGFEQGYKTGYKQAKGTSLAPLVPLCPLYPLKGFCDPRSDFEYGYTIGFKRGMADGSKDRKSRAVFVLPNHH